MEFREWERREAESFIRGVEGGDYMKWEEIGYIIKRGLVSPKRATEAFDRCMEKAIPKLKEQVMLYRNLKIDDLYCRHLYESVISRFSISQNLPFYFRGITFYPNGSVHIGWTGNVYNPPSEIIESNGWLIS